MINIARRLLILIFVAGIFASCWDDFSEREFSSANVLTFGFEQHDSCPLIQNYIFNIDQFKGHIYNLDSLPYGSKVDNLSPTITLQSSNGKIYMNDSLWDGEKDSLDFSLPVKLKNTSNDGSRTRTYTIYVNVHKVDPDSMIVENISGNYPVASNKSKVLVLSSGKFISFSDNSGSGIKVITSEDNGISWTTRTSSGLSEEMNLKSISIFNSKYFINSISGNLYESVDGINWDTVAIGKKFITLFGSINKKYIYETSPVYLIGLVRNESGEVCPAKSPDGLAWEIGNPLDSDFPVSEYAVVKGSTSTNIQFYTIATGFRKDGGLSSSVWSTENGLDWVLIQKKSNNPFLYSADKSGVSLFYYDGYLVCFGGLNSSGGFIKEIRVSKDHGKSWIAAPDNWIFNFIDNGFAFGNVWAERVQDTVNGKDKEFIWFFGGQNETGLSTIVRKGYLNKMLFTRR